MIKKPSVDILAKIKEQYENEGKNKPPNILFYADWGIGKTTLAMTLPKPILLQEFDPGGHRLREVNDLAKSGDLTVDTRWQSQYQMTPTEIYNKWSVDYRKMKSSGVFDQIAEQGGYYVMDSFTLFQKLMIGAVMDRKDKISTHDGSGEFTTLTRRGYGVQHTAVDFVIRDLLGLPCGVMIIAHMEELQDSKGNTLGFEPLITGAKLRKQLPVLFEEIYIMQRIGKKRRLYLEPYGLYNAKSHLISLHPEKIKPMYDVSEKGSFSFERDIINKTKIQITKE